MNTLDVRIRDSDAADVPQIAALYGWHVMNGTGTFEMTPPANADMAQRRADVIANALPWLVAESNGHVVGYAYASQFRPRPAYRFCVEDSIYLRPEAQGHGLGKRLLNELITRCDALGIRQMVALIGDADNQGSIALHRSLGFEHAGVLKSSGRKFDRWLDAVFMQRALGSGDTDAPTERVPGPTT
jgi:L-amino acid N-acyltransferase YncA